MPSGPPESPGPPFGESPGPPLGVPEEPPLGVPEEPPLVGVPEEPPVLELELLLDESPPVGVSYVRTVSPFEDLLPHAIFGESHFVRSLVCAMWSLPVLLPRPVTRPMMSKL